uniref:Uncharacterized protein n=1 Tax=uncultured marine virus TaxID=186617 RepID=A0A0F7L503_9VIRU|nr:hypothetical protein [uncultured marine virus]
MPSLIESNKLPGVLQLNASSTLNVNGTPFNDDFILILMSGVNAVLLTTNRISSSAIF